MRPGCLRYDARIMNSSLAMTPLARWRPSLFVRLSMFALLLLADKILLNGFVDFGRAQEAQGVGAFVRVAQHWGFRFLVAYGASLALFAYVRAGGALQAAVAALHAAPIRLRWLLAHALLLAPLVLLSYALYRYTPDDLSMAAVAVAWSFTALTAALAALLALAPTSNWRALAHALSATSGYALMAALAGIAAMQASQQLWGAAASLTFELVRRVLTPLLPTLLADPTTRVLSTENFAISVAEVCSGLEGVGLVLAFSVAWLVCFRREYRFPQALALIPIGMLVIYVFNVARIAALVLIGDAGYPDVAVYGFHSQAGWIAFNAVACGLVYLSRRSAWLSRRAAAVAETDNPTAVYLMPLLAMLAAGFVSNAVSGRFEYAYPLRTLAVAAALWIYRKPLRRIDWRFSWRAPLVGLCVFALWWSAARWLMPAADRPLGLAAMGPILEALWIACRLGTAVILVPIAEELAYRGFLMRRLGTAHFEELPYARVRFSAVCISAALCGAMYGPLWLPGAAAGLAYGALAVRRDRLGEAVAAHATANALIAATVLAGRDWQLW